MNKRSLFYSLSPRLRFLVRRLYFLPSDIYAGITGKRHPMEPPKGLIYTGHGDFIAHGMRHLGYLKKFAQLRPEHHVLDVGSGMGRSAAALTTYLNNEGRYDGFDVVKLGVDWCIKKITSRFPNFHFRYIDLKNDLYKSKGADATQFIFPYHENKFDIVFLMSVFTHMSVPEIEHYLDEIHKVLKPGGKCLATFFYFDEATLQSIKTGTTAIKFDTDRGHYRLTDAGVTSANICIEYSYLKNMIESRGFKINETIKGYWRNFAEKKDNDYQDMIVMEKN